MQPPALPGTCRQLARSKAPGHALRYCWIWRDTATACVKKTLQGEGGHTNMRIPCFQCAMTEGLKSNLLGTCLTTRHVVKGMATGQPMNL